MTDVAVEQAREEVEQNVRGSFLEDLRSRPDIEPRDIVRRAARLGCDLVAGRGGALRRADDRPPAPRRRDDRRRLPGRAGPAPRGPRVRAAARGGRRRRARGDARARRAGWPRGCSATASSACRPSTPTPPTSRARSRRPSSCSTSCASRDAPIAEDIGTGTYRLLFRVLASHPEEVRSFYEDTVAPLVRYDDQYRTDLVGTLESYLDQNCNMNATASADLRPPPHGGLPPRPREGADRPRPDAVRGPRAPRPRPEGLPDHRAAAAEVADAAQTGRCSVEDQDQGDDQQDEDAADDDARAGEDRERACGGSRRA